MKQASSTLDQVVTSLTIPLIIQMVVGMQQSKLSVNSLACSIKTIMLLKAARISSNKRDLSQIFHRSKNKSQRSPTSFCKLLKLQTKRGEPACSTNVQARPVWAQERLNHVSNNSSSRRRSTISMLLREIRVRQKDCLIQRWFYPNSQQQINMPSHTLHQLPKAEHGHPLQSRRSRLN